MTVVYPGVIDWESNSNWTQCFMLVITFIIQPVTFLLINFLSKWVVILMEKNSLYLQIQIQNTWKTISKRRNYFDKESFLLPGNSDPMLILYFLINLPNLFKISCLTHGYRIRLPHETRALIGLEKKSFISWKIIEKRNKALWPR